MSSKYMDNFWNKYNKLGIKIRKYFDNKYLHKINPYFDMHLKEFKKILQEEENGEYDHPHTDLDLHDWKINFDEIVYVYLWNEMVTSKCSLEEIWYYDRYVREYYEMRYLDVDILHSQFLEYIEDKFEI